MPQKYVPILDMKLKCWILIHSNYFPLIFFFNFNVAHNDMQALCSTDRLLFPKCAKELFLIKTNSA